MYTDGIIVQFGETSKETKDRLRGAGPAAIGSHQVAYFVEDLGGKRWNLATMFGNVDEAGAEYSDILQFLADFEFKREVLNAAQHYAWTRAAKRTPKRKPKKSRK